MLASQDLTYSRGYLGILSIIGAFFSIFVCIMPSVRLIACRLHDRFAVVRSICRLVKALFEILHHCFQSGKELVMQLYCPSTFVRNVRGKFNVDFPMLGRCFLSICASSRRAISHLGNACLARAHRRQSHHIVEVESIDISWPHGRPNGKRNFSELSLSEQWTEINTHMIARVPTTVKMRLWHRGHRFVYRVSNPPHYLVSKDLRQSRGLLPQLAPVVHDRFVPPSGPSVQIMKQNRKC